MVSVAEAASCEGASRREVSASVSSSRSIVGVDLGGTKLAIGLVDDSLGILARSIGTAASASREACLDNLYRRLDAAAAEYGPIDAIGVGTASMVDFRGGRIVQSVNLPLHDVALRDLLTERYGVPVVVDNDANVACLAEFRYGAGIGTSEMIMLTLGTGIGGGIVTNGHLYRGASGAAGEIGHMMIDFDGPSCRGACPNHGCLEVYASGHAMGEAARETARAAPDSGLGRALAAGDQVGGPLLSALALAGDPVAVAVLAGIGEKLGLGIVSLVNIFNPELVVVGGGAAQAADIVLGAARKVVAERALQPNRDQVRIVPARHGVDAGVLGAAALAVIELFPDEAPARGRPL
jgi:glucokinase